MTAAISPRTDDPAHAAAVPLWHGVDDVPVAFGPCVVVLGVFDGLHRGHHRLIEHAHGIGRERGLPVLLVTFDPHPARVLGIDRDTAALSTIGHRVELAADAGVDAVCVLRFTTELAARTPAEFARHVLADGLHARAVVVGANFTFGVRGAGTVDTLDALGTELGFTAHVVALLQTVDTPCSSTHARRCVRAGDLVGAARALGRPHRVDGHRVGDAVRLAEYTALPPAGRYRVGVDGRPGLAEIDPEGRLRLDDEAPHAAGRSVVVTFLGHDESIR